MGLFVCLVARCCICSGRGKCLSTADPSLT
nr:MAG TPA: MTAbl13 of grafted MCoTI-II, trypsin inhibitor, Hydrolase Inhibitor [Caudoviricetes sp.]